MSGQRPGDEPGNRAGDPPDDRVEPLDLTPLDALSQAPALEQHVRRIHLATRAQLAMRQVRQGLGGMIVRWGRPVLFVSLLLALSSIVVLLAVPRTEHPTGSGSTDVVAEGLGIPTDLVAPAQDSAQEPAQGSGATSPTNPGPEPATTRRTIPVDSSAVAPRTEDGPDSGRTAR